jgi:hypothetical protein
MNRYVIYLLLVVVGVCLNLFGPRLWDRRWTSWLFLALPAVATIWYLLAVTDCPWFGDFKNAYYLAGRLALERPSWLYQGNCILGFTNIPVVALLFLPFSRLAYSTAVAVFTVLGAASVVAACCLMLKLTEARGWRRSAVIGLFAMNGPLCYSIKEGNSSHFFLLLFADPLATPRHSYGKRVAKKTLAW